VGLCKLCLRYIQLGMKERMVCVRGFGREGRTVLVRSGGLIEWGQAMFLLVCACVQCGWGSVWIG